MLTHDLPNYCLPDGSPACARDAAPDAYAEWKSWRHEDFGRPTRQACAYFNLLWRRFAANRCQPQKVLEIGFGNGQFLGWCRQRGLTACGTETNEALLARARAAGFDCAGSLAILDAGPFDLIVLFDVLEHIPESGITAFLCSLSDRLAPQGQILLRTPNGGSPFGLNNQYGDPTHAAVLTPNKLKFLSAPAGLQMAFSGADPRPLRGLPPAKWPALALRLLLHRLLERLVRFVFAPLPRGVLAANLLTVLRHSTQGRQQHPDRGV